MRHNHLAVAAAVAADNVLGYLFHAPFTFLDVWARGLGSTADAFAEPSTGALTTGVVASFVTMYALSWLIRRLDITTGSGGVRVAAYAALGLVLPATAVQYAYAGIGLGTALVDGGHLLSALLVGGFLMAPRRAARAAELPAAAPARV